MQTSSSDFMPKNPKPGLGKILLPSPMNKQYLPWHSRFDLLGITFLLFLAASIGAIPSIEGSGRDLDYLGNLSRFVSQFFPPDWSILDRTCLASGNRPNRSGLYPPRHRSFLPHFLGCISECGTAMGPLAHSYAAESDPNHPQFTMGPFSRGDCGFKLISRCHRTYSLQRGLPCEIFSETFESTDLSSQKALTSLGAGPIQAFQYGLWPMPGPSSGAIVYGCWSTMYARLALLDMWVREVSVYTSNSMLNLPIVGINFHSFYCASW